MTGDEFVELLKRENEEIFARLAPLGTLAADDGGSLDVEQLLLTALRNELEATEIAALWLPSARDFRLKLALARQAGDEAKHYRLIEQRLRELGHALEGFDPLAGGYSPMFKFLAGLRHDVERVAAGQFTREAIALVKNAQFIELCEARGDKRTAQLYREVIQPDEKFHQQLGAEFLARLASSEEAQALARAARERTISLAEELQAAAFQKGGIHHGPGC